MRGRIRGRKFIWARDFDLEDAEGVGLAEHVVGRRVLGRERRQRPVLPVVEAEEVEGLADAGEHAEGEDVDLEDAEAVDVVLVPADDGAVLHRRVLDGDKLVEPAFGHDEAAHVLGEVAGEALDLVDQLQRLGEAAVGRVEADLAQALMLQPFGGEEAPELGGDGGDRVVGQAHGAARPR